MVIKEARIHSAVVYTRPMKKYIYFVACVPKVFKDGFTDDYVY